MCEPAGDPVAGRATGPCQTPSQLASHDWIACGEPVLVLVRTWKDEVVVAEPQVILLGHESVLRARSHTATVIRGSSSTDLESLRTFIEDTRRTQVRSFRRCGDCGERQPPAWMISDEHGQELR